MKATEYHLFDVVFVIEATASCGVYLNEMKTNYIVPALEFFSQGMEDIYSPANKSASSMFGIVCFKTQNIPNPQCTTFGPFISPQKFIKTIDNLDLTGGRSECNASLAEGLATALVCFQDLEKSREKEPSTKHCILISNSSPYTMPVSECYEYEGKTVEQLAAVFLEKKINLSVISPRKIPILFEIFEKSGGDLALTASKNYSKDPRHLVLLKGFSLKERPASPTMNQPAQAATPNVLPNPQPAPLMPSNEQPNAIMNNNPGMRQMNPNIRQNNPQMIPQQQQQQTMGNPPPPFAGGQQMNNFPQRQANPQQPTQQQQQRWIAPNQTRPPFLPGNLPQNPMMQQNQSNQNQQPQNSALISQLTQPPNINAMTPQQQAMARMAAMQNQQQNQQQMMQQNQQPNLNVMQNNQMIAGNQVNQQQNIQGMAAQNQQQQGIQQINTQQQQQGGMAPGGIQGRERIWRGILEWNDKQNQQNTTRQVQCEIYASVSKDTNEIEVRGENWPARLIMQLMPRAVITNVGGQLLRDAKIVNFQWGPPSDAFESLSKVMANGFAGCVHFTPSQCDVKILILLYMPDKKSYYGFIPNDQNGYVDRLRRVIQQSKIMQFGQNPGPQNVQQQPGPRPQMMGMNPIAQQNTMNAQNTPQNIGNMQQQQQQQQGDQSMMFNQQMQMQGGPNMVPNQPMNPNQQRMARPMMQNNNLRHLLQQQQQNQFRPQMGGPQQQQQPNQMHGGMDQTFDLFQ